MIKPLKQSLYFFLISTAFLNAQISDSLRLITVSGDADVYVIPDEVLLTFGVVTNNKKLNIAKEDNDKVIQEIFEIVAKNNIKPKDIQTDYLNIEPKYEDYYHHIKDFIGYSVTKTFIVTLKDLSKFESLLSEILEAGANYVYSISFQTTKLREYRDKARSLAIIAAREKAIALAKELNQEIGIPYNIQENESGWWNYYNSWWRPGRISIRGQNVFQNAENDGETDATIALGQIKVSASVTVCFKLK